MIKSDRNGPENETVLSYLVREPRSVIAKSPLIILLHGVGSNENDLFSFAGHLPAKFLVISARAPLIAGKDSYAWYQVDFSSGKPSYNKEQAEKSRNMIHQFIGQLKMKYRIDETQIHLCGFSQGAIMAYYVGLTQPDKIKGIAAMSGRILDEVKPMIASGTDLHQLKIFISHGTNDQVLTVQYGRDAAAYLKKINLNPTYREYPAGHTITDAMFRDLVDWFNE